MGRPLVYIDESGFSEATLRTHGYALTGKRCYRRHDWGAKGRINVIGALLGKALLTLSLFSFSINTDIFNAWIKQDLIPKLPPQSVVIIDNASFHKGEEMQKSLSDAGHTLLYLPPYSPDLTPIECKWAQCKAQRRKMRCSVEELFQDLSL
jgi:hypothetical protein